MESIKAMSVKERLELIQAIWKTLDEEVLDEELEDEEELALLKERYEEYLANPDGTTESWEDVKARMLKKLDGKK